LRYDCQNTEDSQKFGPIYLGGPKPQIPAAYALLAFRQWVTLTFDLAFR